MKTVPTQNPRKQRATGQVWVCVLLIGLVLYNPFVGLTASPDKLSYEKLARNRATLGSSEMQYFCPVRSESEQPNLDVAVIGSEIAVEIQEDQPWPVVRKEHRGPLEESGSLWFRPPPTQ